MPRKSGGMPSYLVSCFPINTQLQGYSFGEKKKKKKHWWLSDLEKLHFYSCYLKYKTTCNCSTLECVCVYFCACLMCHPCSNKGHRWCMCEIFCCHCDCAINPQLWQNSTPPTHTDTSPTHTHSDVIVIHPSSEAVTSIKLSIVSFSLGWRKDLYLSADVWPTHTHTQLWSSVSKCLSKWTFCASDTVPYTMCNEELYHCLQCISPSECHCQLARHSFLSPHRM